MKQKKIVVFNGSPRIHGNTAKLVEAFEKGAKEAGKLRSEGKEYVMQDGDVCLFRFNN